VIVKICGLTRVEDAAAAAEAGADMVGFVFAPSPRTVSVASAREMSRAVSGAGTLKVGVFVDAEAGFVRWTVEETGLDLVQLHGRESPAYCRSLPVGVIKAVRVKDNSSLEEAKPYLETVRFLLLDSWRPGLPGGTGLTFDWSLAEGVGKCGVPWLLAGGLHAGNVAQAVAACRPDGVDVSGGVEAEPGVKDHQLMRRFIEAARGGYGG